MEDILSRCQYVKYNSILIIDLYFEVILRLIYFITGVIADPCWYQY